ncbi:MAG: TetR family transcriptional regulator [Leucobacter sp.]|nr:TetR family transcriptional regulator [Leucobacter sp.]
MAYLPRDERRAAIVEATIRVMRSAGFEGVSARSVAAEVGGSPGLIHQHFSSVSSLTASAWRAYVAESLEGFAGAVHGGERDPVEEFFGNHLDPAQGAELSLWVSAWAHALRSPDFGSVFAESLAALTQALRAADPELSEGAAERTVLLGVALAGMQQIAPERYDAGRLAEIVNG